MMVLGAIQSGAKKFDKIRKITHTDPEELNTILEELENAGFIAVEQKKGFFGPKVELWVTEKGMQELQAGIQEMHSKWGQMQTMYKQEDKGRLKGFMDDNRSFFPMMIFFGIMDMMMFSMMFSMIGSSMGNYVPADDIPEGMDDGGQDYSDPGMDGGGGFDFDLGF